MIKAETLRKCILRDAVMGKMSHQRPEDGNARDEVKEAIIGEVYGAKIPFDIPDNWCWVRLGEVCTFVNGRAFKPKEWGKEGLPIVRIQNLNNPHENYNYYNGTADERFMLRGNELLFAWSASLGVYTWKGGNAVLNQHIFRVEAHDTVLKEYIQYCLEWRLKDFKNLAHGTTMKHIRKPTLEGVIIPIPPMSEQLRIVSRFEPILQTLDDLADHQKKLLNARRILRKSLLKEAIEGKLMEHLPDDGDARELAREAVIGEFSNEEKLPFELPANWCWVRLGDIVTLNPRNHLPDDMPVSFLPMDKLEGGYGSAYTPSVRRWGDVRKGFTHFRDGDIIVAKITPCFQNRKSALVYGLMNGYGAGTTELHVLRANECADSRYIFWLAKSEYFINTGANRMQGTAGQKRWRTCYFRNFLVPLPPLKEQKRIVQKLDAMLATLDEPQ